MTISPDHTAPSDIEADCVIPRRHFLTASVVLASAATLGVTLPPPAAEAAPPAGRRWDNRVTANGWPVLPAASWRAIEGSGLQVRLAGGPPAVLLVYVARRFHYEIDQLRSGDLEGHRTDTWVEQAYESNHLSGTALTIRRAVYPRGVRGGLYPTELVVVRDILAELDGAVAWGGDLHEPTESHFHIVHPPGHSALTRTARRISRTGDTGAAGVVDAFSPGRRHAAQAFHERHSTR